MSDASESKDPDRDSRPVGRPAPQYGEYAPEGWTSPVLDETEHTNRNRSRDSSDETSREVSSPDASPQQDKLAGVPHNLGAPARAGSQTARSDTSTAVPSRASETISPPTSQGEASTPSNVHVGDPHAYHAPPPAQSALSTRSNRRTGDRVATIILLCIGALGALGQADSYLQLVPSLVLTSDILGIQDPTIPSWISTFGVVGAIVILALYAITLVYSIRRLRARRLTFWVPLVAGVVATLLLVISTSITTFQVPELMELLSDPTKSAEVLNTLLSDAAFGQ